jgi:CrcB protein
LSVGVWVAAAALGGFGAILRFGVDGAISRRLDRDFPYGTLAVNLSGAAVLGLTTGLVLRGTASVLLGPALIGAYTTFSTWMLETQRLAEEGELAPAAANWLLSLALGLAVAAAGRWIGMRL